jgi:hypothetical protein
VLEEPKENFKIIPVWQIFSLSNDSTILQGKFRHLHDELQAQITNWKDIRYKGGYIPHQHEFRAQEHKNEHSCKKNWEFHKETKKQLEGKHQNKLKSRVLILEAAETKQPLTSRFGLELSA